MKLYIYLFFTYLNLPKYNSLTFNLSNNSYLSTYHSKEEVGEVIIYTYRPKNPIRSIKYSDEHSLELPASNRIVRLIIITKGEDIKLVHITYTDLSRDNILDDLYYHKVNGEFARIQGDLFYVSLVKLSQTYKTLNLSSLVGDWFTCYDGLTEKKLCSFNNYYFLTKIVVGDKVLWENKSHFKVHSVEIGLKESEEGDIVKLKLYCYINNENKIIDHEFPISKTEADAISRFVERDQPKRKNSVTSQIHGPKVVHVIDTKQLKDIRLYFESDNGSSKNYKVRHNILLGLDNTYYEPTPGVELQCIKDGNTVIWSPSAQCKKFIHARFTYLSKSPVLLNIRYMNEIPKSCYGTKLVEVNEFFMKYNGWHTISEDKYNNKLEFLMNKKTKETMDSGVSYEYVLPPEEPATVESQDDPKNKNRLKDVKLELDPPDPNGFDKCSYLMDGLDTFFYHPKQGKSVKSVLDGSTVIWSSEPKFPRKLKHAKFAYKNNSHIFLTVLYSETDPKSKGEHKEVNKNDYFVKRDQWYNSPEDQFYEEFDKLKNKVTMRDVILNEKKSFEEHVSDLTFPTIKTEQGWMDQLRRKKPKERKIIPFQYNILDKDHEHLLVEANLKEKFAIYTPDVGYALTRLFDQKRLIWYQERDGLGCTTFYIDLSGDHPLLHLMLDDPINSHIYYKKMDNNWHIIDKKEYEEIRKPPNGPADPNDFFSV
ncbi:hypothetical protein MACK_002261 [Theileria orientalis]|uniref:Signal peptide-containing protein n=1 Tax=Theileria orientalis TaxID=68886 RepID=A0A976MBD4_THEOR|nr:hypothetical protein MACK_002261 [Theileria orientalis]